MHHAAVIPGNLVNAERTAVQGVLAETGGSALRHQLRGNEEIQRRLVARTGVAGHEFDCAAPVEVVTEARPAQVQANERGRGRRPTTRWRGPRARVK